MNRTITNTLIVVVIIAIALAPFAAGNYTVSLLNRIGISSLVALGLILLTGIGGIISFGQATFVGLAAYASAWLTTAQGLSPWLGLLLALVVTGICALVIGVATLRLGGHFLALSTIAWGLAIPIVFGSMDALGRHTGLSNIPPVHVGPWSLADPHRMYYLIWIVVGLSFLFCYNLLKSRPGRTIRSLRGGSTLLASVGADAYRIRISLFVLAAVLAALAGWLYAHMNRFVSPSAFNVEASIDYLLMAIAGGLGSLAGAVLGAALVIEFKNALTYVLPMLTNYAASVNSIVFFAIFIGLMHFARGGLTGFLNRWRHLAAPVSPRPRVSAETSVPPLPHRTVATADRPILSVDGVVKRFGGLIAVNEVTFDVYANEIVGLIGPNGAGKSTMFNLLTRTMEMTSGKVQFLNQDISKMQQREVARMGLARTFQHVKLRPYMSLLDNVALGAYARASSGMLRAGLRLNTKEERQLLQEAQRQLERIGLGNRANEMAGSLPLGTQRILEIARALAADPVLLLLDEPAAGLRRKEKQALGTLLRQLRDEGVTILIVEHDMEFVMQLVDRLVVMNFGSKLVEGNPASVRANKEVQDAYLGGQA